MKDFLIIVIIALITVAIGGGAFYLFALKTPREDQEILETEPKDEDTEDYTSGYPGQGETEEDIEDTDDLDGECPEGVVCFGGSEIPTIPTITLGSSAVYAAELEETEEETGTDEDSEYGTITSIEDNTPQAVLITNKDFRTWSVVWVTDTAETGYLEYGMIASQLAKKAYDDRDSDVSNLDERFTHHVTITNSETDLSQDDLTYYFHIVSGGEEFKDNGSLYEYNNAPLTSSPSTPASVSITSDEISGYSATDYIVAARQKDASEERSTSVSGVYNVSGGIELIIGIAREQSLNSYFPYSTSNNLEVKLYGPDGYTGYVSAVNLGSLDTEILNIQLSKTGYGGSVFASSAGSNYLLDDEDSSSEVEQDQNQQESLPQTGIEDSWAFTSIFGLVMFLLGTCCVIVFIPWNYKRLWERKVVSNLDDE